MSCTRVFLWYSLTLFLMRKFPLLGSARTDWIKTRSTGVFVSLFLSSHSVIEGAIFTVTTTGDSGAGSFRQAILDANATAGTDTIEFQIPGIAPFTISPTLPLPPLNEPVVINATTQPGYIDRPVVELDGSLLTVAGVA